MSTPHAQAIAVRFTDKAWHVDGAGIFLGPYLSRHIAVRVAALHAKSIIAGGGRARICIHDEAGRLVGCWSHPTQAPHDAAASTVA
jgi:hypothetical protein